jgi:hypothetical protein
LYLTAAERAAVQTAARGAEIAGEPNELVRQALAAVCTGQADDVAFSVTEAAGVKWITPSIWYRERWKVNAELARAILAQGKKDATFEAPIPEDDAKAISEAEDLVEMAQTAWNQMMRGPEVEVLLKMASEGMAQNGDTAIREAIGEDGGKDVSPPQDGVEDEAQKVQVPNSDGGGEVPSGGEEPQEAPQAGDLSNVEPWEGYDREKVSEVKKAISAAIRDYNEDELTDLMANVWAYESAHKARQTILDYLDDVAKKLQSGEDLGEETPADTERVTDDVQKDDEGPAPEEQAGEVDEASSRTGESDLPSRDEDEPGDGHDGSLPEHDPSSARDHANLPGDGGEPKGEEEPGLSDDGLPERDAYQRLIEQVEAEVARERVHTPKNPADEEEIPDLPWDWTKMSNKQLQQYHGVYSALAYFKSYKVSVDERVALHCKAAADELHNALLTVAERYDEHGKEKRVAILEAEIESDENVVAWRRRQRKHETFAASHRNERDSIGKLVDALSRHESMRQQEWERSRKA